MRPDAGRAALEVAVEARARAPRPRRLALVAQLGPRQPELAGPLGERPAAARATVSCRPATSSAAERATCSFQGASASRDETPCATRRSAAFRCADRRAVLGRAAPARLGDQPSEHAVEVRPARGGPALDDHEPVGREDERRHLAAQLLGRAQLRAVQRRPLAAAELERHLELERRRRPASRAARPAPPPAPKRTSCASARVRGEKPCVPTCSDSSRFVLPAPFGPVTSTSPGSSSSSSFAYERKSLSATDGDVSAGQPDRHDQVQEVVALALDHGRAAAG